MLRVLISLVAFLFVFSPPMLAQDTTWEFYVFNPNTGDLVRLDLDGNRITYTLSLDNNTFISSQGLAFNTDGSWVAFCAVHLAGERPTHTLYVRDLTDNTPLLTLELPHVTDCHISSVSLQGDELALGLIHYLYADEAINDTTPIWELRILNVVTGEVVQSLGADAPALAVLEQNQQLPYMPDVRVFSAEQVAFAQIPWLGSENLTEVPSLLWNRTTDTVSSAALWGKQSVEHHATSQEMIWVDYDPRFPRADPNGFNVVMVRNAAGSANPIYHSADWVVLGAKFIEGGARIAINLMAPFDPSQPLVTFQTTRWLALDRMGTLTDLVAPTAAYSELVPAPSGYMLLNFAYQDDDFSQPLISLQYHTNDQTTELWQTTEEYWNIVWTAPLPMPELIAGAFLAVSGE